MYECGDCYRRFPSGWRARDQHCNATGHSIPDFECFTCYEYFDDNWERSQHMHDWYHLPDEYYECAICIEVFRSNAEVTKHEVHNHFYCRDCERTFNNFNNIKMHLNSRTHRGEQITCPFCKRHFATATGLAHHLEGAACPNAPSINRDEVYKLVRRVDPHGMISKKQIGWTGSATSRYEASDRAWNGYNWECYFCHRSFGKLESLNQHLNSPAHQQPLYHCPNHNCRLDFKTLAAIINHLESESCSFMRFEQVQKKIGGIVRGDRLLTF
ncbi:hypothetical protein QBC41DRAFT_99369 [Cercophora samala]|uniref:C2H2-type domain-containing protein n=1 Tax=Cercophora samala TaxID=330535 RepID=A0AA39ZFW7_9PEZI|nr:hypothetical protein QBC41DRAFT_99369 [Cercophora samala]